MRGFWALLSVVAMGLAVVCYFKISALKLELQELEDRISVIETRGKLGTYNKVKHLLDEAGEHYIRARRLLELGKREEAAKEVDAMVRAAEEAIKIQGGTGYRLNRNELQRLKELIKKGAYNAKEELRELWDKVTSKTKR